MEEEAILKNKVKFDLIDLTYRKTQYILWAEAITAFLLFYVVLKIANFWVVITWLVVNLCIIFSRMILVFTYHRLNNLNESNNKIWVFLYTLGAFFSGLIWGSSTLILPYGTLQYYVVGIFLYGVSAIGSAFYSRSKLAASAFIIPALVPRFIFNFIYLAFSLSFGTFIFLMALIFTAFHSHNLLRNSLYLSYKNSDLAKALLSSGQLLSILNTNLRHEVNIRKKIEKKLKILATYDNLTKLPNRNLLDLRFPKILASAKRKNKLLAFFYLDLDNFKRINDLFGHLIGDKLLVVISEKLRHIFRTTDQIARLGGDEFCILIDDIGNHTQISDIANKLLKILNEKIIIEKYDITITASIGISIYPNDGSDFLTLINKADIALYHAKSSGKSCFVFYDKNM